MIYPMSVRWFEGLPELPRSLAQVGYGLRFLWQAVWVGLLDADTLNGITWSHCMRDSAFEAEDFNIRRGVWPWEAAAVQGHFGGHGRVLVAGAGGGREVVAFARLGYDVTAFDFSPYLTAACRRNLEKVGYAARVFDAPPDGLPNTLDHHDALLIGRGFCHHIPGRSRRVAFLRACRGCPDACDPIIHSDFFIRETNSRFYVSTWRIANGIRASGRQSERLQPGDWLSNCMQHAFTRGEILQELDDAQIGLETYAISPFSEASHLAYAIGHAI